MCIWYNNQPSIFFMNVNRHFEIVHHHSISQTKDGDFCVRKIITILIRVQWNRIRKVYINSFDFMRIIWWHLSYGIQNRGLCNYNCLHYLHSQPTCHIHRLALVNEVIIWRKLFKLSCCAMVAVATTKYILLAFCINWSSQLTNSHSHPKDCCGFCR